MGQKPSRTTQNGVRLEAVKGFCVCLGFKPGEHWTSAAERLYLKDFALY